MCWIIWCILSLALLDPTLGYKTIKGSDEPSLSAIAKPGVRLANPTHSGISSHHLSSSGLDPLRLSMHESIEYASYLGHAFKLCKYFPKTYMEKQKQIGRFQTPNNQSKRNDHINIQLNPQHVNSMTDYLSLNLLGASSNIWPLEETLPINHTLDDDINKLIFQYPRNSFQQETINLHFLGNKTLEKYELKRRIGLHLRNQQLSQAIELLSLSLEGSQKEKSAPKLLKSGQHSISKTHIANLASGTLNLSIRHANKSYIKNILTVMKAYDLEIGESSYSTLISVYAFHGKILNAIKTINFMVENKIATRLRSYLPIILALMVHTITYFEQSSTSESIDKINHEKLVLYSFKLIINIIQDIMDSNLQIPMNYWLCIILYGLQVHNFSKIQKGYSQKFLDTVLSLFRVSETPVFPQNFTKSLKSLFNQGLCSPFEIQLVDRIKYLNTNEYTKLHSINHFQCPNCKQTINCSKLKEKDKDSLLKEILNLISHKNTKDLVKLKDFENFLSSRNNYTVILDGANIGYEGQNKEEGFFCFLQIEIVYRELINRGEKPLIILPRSYSYYSPSIPNRSKLSARRKGQNYTPQRKLNNLLPFELELIKRWEEEGSLFICEYGSHDDYYYFYASLKADCRVVTNDLLRDHCMSQNQPYAFERWKELYIIRFHFAPSISMEFNNKARSLTNIDELIQNRIYSKLTKLHLRYPNPYQFDIQESNASQNFSNWHVPVLKLPNDDFPLLSTEKEIHQKWPQAHKKSNYRNFLEILESQRNIQLGLLCLQFDMPK